MADRLHQLLEACVAGNAWIVSAILDEGIDVDASDDDDVTALQVASANGHDHLVHLLIIKGAALDKANSSGWTPLLHASRHGHTNIVALLLQNQADINARTHLGANAMILAARGGHLQTCQLLEDYEIDLSFPNGTVDGSTCEFNPAMVAALHGHDNILRRLLDRGNDVNFQTITLGTSSLMFAALGSHVNTAQMLIEHGADPNLTNINGDTAFEIAMVRGSREIQNFLDRKTTRKQRAVYQDFKPDIIDATRHGNIQRIREILDEDITQRDACLTQDGATPLMFAAMAGRLDIAMLLVEKGCDVNKQDSISGWTALMQAIFHSKKEMVKYLLGIGSDILLPAKNGCTAFDMVTLLENVDTELCRLISSRATKAAQYNHVDPVTRKTKTSVNRDDSTSTVELISMDTVSEENSKNALKAWWNRMSNRFRNLKLGRTFNLNTSRMNSNGPVEELETTTSLDSTNIPNPVYKKSSSPESPFVKSEKENAAKPCESRVPADRNTGTTLFTLGMLSTTSSNPLNNTMKAPPPFLPPPTFQTNSSKMPPISLKKSVNRSGSTPALAGGLAPSMRSFMGHSALSLVANSQQMRRVPFRVVPKPPANRQRVSVTSAEVSPSASSNASALSNGMSKVASSTSSSTGTLTAGSGGGDNVSNKTTESMKRESKLLTPDASSDKNSFDVVKDSTKPSDKSTLALSSKLKPNSSPSNASTLTPSPSIISRASKPPHLMHSHRKHLSSVTAVSTGSPLDEVPVPEDIGQVLNRLSLERYQPIFEEQEVDMEAFLSLNNQDLLELGVLSGDSRHQILATIHELNLKKDRERQQYQQTLSHFGTSSPLQIPFKPGSRDVLDFSEWNLSRAVQQQ